MKTILITGATSGHGYYLAKRLAQNHRILLHGRDRHRTENLATQLGAEAYVADLSDLAQVRRLAADITAHHPRIDVLINNAGIGYGTRRELSVDGHELRFAVNYLAPILLSRLLLPHITSQILNIGSLGQESIDFDDLTMQQNYNGITAYRRAKLALVMATFDLAMERPDLQINVVHPATYMDTNMIRDGGGTPLHTVEYGGEATLRVMDSQLTGTFFNEDKPVKANEDAYRLELRLRLRNITDTLLGFL